MDSGSFNPAFWRAGDSLGCDVHTHAHVQDSLQNMLVEEMGTVGSLQNSFWQGYGHEYHSSLPAFLDLFGPGLLEVEQVLGALQDLKARFMSSFQTTLTPNPEKLYTYYSVKKHRNMILNVLSKRFQVLVPVVWKSAMLLFLFSPSAHGSRVPGAS